MMKNQPVKKSATRENDFDRVTFKAKLVLTFKHEVQYANPPPMTLPRG
jgi:hypothetical protein